MVRIRGVQDCCVIGQGIHLLVQDVEVAGVVQLKGSGEGEGVHPRKDGVKEVAGDVETLVASSQLHHVAAGAGEAKQSSETVTDCATTAVTCGDSRTHWFVWFGLLTRPS